MIKISTPAKVRIAGRLPHIAGCIGLLLGRLTTADAADAWFGITPPPDQLDAHRAVVNVASVAVPPAHFAKGDEKHTELAGKRIQRDLVSVVAFSEQSRKAGDKVWGRVTGFPAAEATARWVADQFKAAGLTNVNVEEYAAAPQTPMWWSKQWEVRVLAAPAFGKGTRDVVLQSAVATSGSMIPREPRASGGGVIPAKAGTLTGELVATGTIADELPDVDVKGKIAIQHLHPLTGAYSERTRTVQRAQELAKRGAIAVLNVVEQTGNMQVRDFGNCSVPCFNLGTTDGVFLDRVIERAVNAGALIQVRLSLDAERLSGISNSAPFLIATAQRAMERYGFNLNPTFIENVPGDLGGYAPLNVARVQAIHSGPMYHTSGDVVSTISVPGLERAARFYAWFVTEIARMPASQINPPKN